MKTFKKISLFVLLLVQICLAQWVQTNGPYGGPVNCFAVSGTNLFAGIGGLFVSTNNGTSWTEIGFTNYNVNALAVSEGNLFAGTDGGGIFLSSDNGANWSAVNQGLPKDNYGYIRISDFAVMGTNLFAGNLGGGVFLSTNNGASWMTVNTGLNNTFVWSLAVYGTNLFAGTYAGVFLSTNNGASWTAVNTGGTNSTVLSLAVSGTNLFAGTNDSGVFLSTDNGASWIAVNSGLPNDEVWSLAVSGTNLFAGTYDSGVFLSTNNGLSWTAVNTGLICTNIYALAVLDTSLFAGTLNGVFLSTNNGMNWRDVSPGITTRIVSLEAIGTSVFAGNMWGGVYRLMDNETSWTRLNLQLPIFRSVSCFANVGSNLFAGTTMAFGSGPGVFLSTNNGITWNLVNNGLADIDILDLAVSGTNIFAGTENGVFLSTNNGEIWVKKGLEDTRVSALAVLEQNLFAGTWGSGVFLSSNNGDSWTAVNKGLPKDPYGYIDISSFALIDTNLFIGISTYPYYGIGGVALSTNNGISWTMVNTGLTNLNINSLAVSSTNIFVWTDDGVFLSSNNGSSWFSVNQNLPNYMPTHNIYNTLVISGQNLFAGTEIGVWKRPISEMITDVESTTELPKDFALYQNYPNPFNPNTKIKYTVAPPNLPQGEALSKVILKVYDILGNEVATLVDEYKPAGTYEVIWNVKGLSSGVYFYQLKSNNYVETKKMILLK